MWLGFITFLSALTISAVAIYYSVAGLAAIFAAAVIPIIIMGVSLEVGKLVTAVWLHRNWTRAVWWLKTYLAIAVFVLMFITSMGIFGYLSKAHIEQTSMSQEQVALITSLDDKLARSEAKITRWQTEMDRLLGGEDIRVDNLIDREQVELDKINALIKAEKDDIRKDFDKQIELQNKRIEQAKERKEADIQAAKDRFEGSFGGGAKFDEAVEKAKANELAVASSAQKEIRNINSQLNDALAKVDAKYADDIKAIQDRIQDLRGQANAKTEDLDARITELETFIDKEQNIIDNVREEKFTYEKTYRQLEAEVGPIKYIAEFIYGEQADQSLLEAAVRWVIIIIIFVFDPLAVLLLIASQYTFHWYREEKGLVGPGGGTLPPKPDKDPEPDPEPPYTQEQWDEAHLENEEFNRKRDEQLRAEKIATNVPPVIEPLVKMTEEEEYRNAGITKEEAEKKPEEIEDLKVAEEIEEAMKGEGDDLDKWNNWVEAANKEAEKEPEKNPTTFIHTGDGQNNVTVQEALELPKEEAVDKEIELPDTQNRIFYTKELEQSDAPKKKGSSYIVKEQGNQVRKKTNPGE
tara:strand:+ start:5744 stop:7477 length:1734 start_codon:yes stop_codon:yes gene_type:complete